MEFSRKISQACSDVFACENDVFKFSIIAKSIKKLLHQVVDGPVFV